MTAAVIGLDRKDARWWRDDLPEEKRYKAILENIKRINKAQIFRKDTDLRYARLYGNMPLLGFGVASYSRPATMFGSRLAINVVKSCSDAFTAKMAKDRPKVTFLTSGADWGLQQKAKQLEKFTEALFYDANLYETAPRAVLDACIFGTGPIKIFVDGSGEDARIVAERTFIWELVVDDQEAMYGMPRSLYQRKYIDRLVLQHMYRDNPELVAKLEKTQRDKDDTDSLGYESTADQVMVTEAWHLPSGRGAKDGRHCIVVENATLLDEKYERDYFPFVFYRRQHSPVGFYGTGLAEDLMGLQLEINVLLQKIQRSHHLMAAAHWLLQNGSKVNSAHIDNDIGSIIRYTGAPPTAVIPNAVQAEVYQHLTWLIVKSYETAGINQMTAQAQKPAGLNSGKAIQVYDDVQTDRFTVSAELYQSMFIEIARQMLDLARDISKDYPDYELKAHARNSMSRIRFLDVNLRDEEMVLKLYPTNKLADDPAARIDQVQSMANAGWIDPSDAKRLLDFPDLEAASSYENASYDLTMELIDKIMVQEEPEFVGPEPVMNLPDAMKRFQLAYLRGKARGAEPERLAMLLDWIKSAKSIHDMQNPPAPPAPPMPGPPPGMPPGPQGPGAPMGPPPGAMPPPPPPQAPPMAA